MIFVLNTEARFPSLRKEKFTFKDSMILSILQFTLFITFHYVLHRFRTQEIHCQKLYVIYLVSVMSFGLVTRQFTMSPNKFFDIDEVAKSPNNEGALDNAVHKW